MKSFDLVAIIRRMYAIVVRRFGLIIIPMLILAPGSVVVYKLLPRTYKSYTKLLLTEPKTDQTLVAQIGRTSQVNKRINLLINVVMSQNVLGQLATYIAKKNGVKLTQREHHQWAEGLRSKVNIWNMGQGLVQMEYKCQIRAECLDHLTYLFKLFIQETTKPEQTAIKQTAKFLTKQLARLRQRLQQSEASLTEFKRKHSLELPKTFQANLTNYLSVSKQLFQDQQSLVRAQSRRDFLRQQINKLDPSLVRFRKNFFRMFELKIRLANTLSRYTRRHPKVRRLQRQVRSLQRAIVGHRLRRLQTLKQIEQATRVGRVVPRSKRGAKDRKNSATLFDKYQETIFRTQELKNQIKANQKQFAKLKKLLDDYPLREQQLNELTRDAEIARTIYTKVRTLHEQSLLQRELDIFDASRRVRVIEPAALPLYPISPKFLFVVGGAIFAAFAFSFLLIAFAELFDPTFTDDEEVTELLGVNVIGEVKDLPQIEL